MSGVMQSVFDEAGDTGIGPRSSRYLVVAGVGCANLEPLRKAVAKTRKTLGKELRDIPELKAWHTPTRIVARLLERIVGLDVEIYAAILDKYSAHRPAETEDWYRQVYAEVVRQASARYTQVTVTMDNRYTKPLLRDRLVQSIVVAAQRPGTTLSFVYADSRQERALQAVDAVAWSVFQKYEHENDAFYRLIEARLAGEVLLLR